MMNAMTEDVIAAQQGNLAAFERLVNATRNMVTSVALVIVKDIDVSEDIAQQAYINCWNNINTLKNSHSFLPWLRQSTRYIAINYLRDNKVSSKVVGIEAEQLFAQFSAVDGQPEALLNDKQKKHAVAQLLETLPNESREIVTLYYREEQSIAVVAELFGLSEATVRKKLSRARFQLKERVLEQFGRTLLTTAPTVSFTAIVISSLAISPNAAASVTVSATTTYQASFWSKLAGLFSGGIAGSLAGALAILWSHKTVEKKLTDEQVKKQLNKLKNISLVWMFSSGALLLVSYHFTSGAWAPITTYGLFAFGLHFLTTRSQSLIHLDFESNPNIDITSSHYSRQKLWGAIGLYGGLIMGGVVMLLGLFGSGRL